MQQTDSYPSIMSKCGLACLEVGRMWLGVLTRARSHCLLQHALIGALVLSSLSVSRETLGGAASVL